ncbi:Uma2 family endonuclease [Amycolatopsis sp. NPDC059021]|uniref:Uma2 family endonuclease n=1 Tax=Amycolatopsis sp. NPDC059021 TaxID=3346704 RepID=UPI00366A6689
MAVSTHRGREMVGLDNSWTLDDVLALPEDQTTGQRVELVDGALLVSPWPRVRHQRMLSTLQRQLHPVVPSVLEMLPGANIVLGHRGDRLVVPDLVINRDPGFDGVYLTEDQVFLVCEIESRSTKLKDRTLKRALYAEGRIPYYLLVDPAEEPAAATMFALSGEDYEPIAKSEGGRLELTRPFTASIDLA